MKPIPLKELKAELAATLRGELAPARVYTIEPDGKGGYVRTDLDPEEYRRQQAAQAAEPPNEASAARAKLKLSQAQFSKLLGVSVGTVQDWERGRRKPRGAAKVLLRVAAQHPDSVLAAG